MRTTLMFSLTMLVAVLGFLSCGPKPDEGSPVADPTIGGVSIVACLPSDVCGYLIQATLSDSDIGNYKYVLKLYRGEVEHYSEPVTDTSDGTSSIDIEFFFPYFHPIDTAWYNYAVVKFDASSEVRDMRERLTATSGEDTLQIPYLFNPGCDTTCCTDTSLVRNRWKAGASRVQEGIYGVQADFYLPNYPKMCGESISSMVTDRSFGYIGAFDSSKGIWCQTGFIKGRESNGETFGFVYMEVGGPDTVLPHVYGVMPFPSSTAPTRLRIELDPSTGTWTFHKDDIHFIGYTIDERWKGVAGDTIHIAGEIVHHETDMFGFEGTPLKIQNSGWKDISGGWHGPLITEYLRYSNDSTEWWCDTLGTENAIQIYDRKPLP